MDFGEIDFGGIVNNINEVDLDWLAKRRVNKQVDECLFV